MAGFLCRIYMMLNVLMAVIVEL